MPRTTLIQFRQGTTVPDGTTGDFEVGEPLFVAGATAMDASFYIGRGPGQEVAAIGGVVDTVAVSRAATVADLKAMDPGVFEAVVLEGHTTPNDGGQGFLVRTSDATNADEGMKYQSTHTGTVYWERVTGCTRPEYYGGFPDGVTDILVPFKAAVVGADNYGVPLMLYGGANYAIGLGATGPAVINFRCDVIGPRATISIVGSNTFAHTVSGGSWSLGTFDSTGHANAENQTVLTTTLGGSLFIDTLNGKTDMSGTFLKVRLHEGGLMTVTTAAVIDIDTSDGCYNLNDGCQLRIGNLRAGSEPTPGGIPYIVCQNSHVSIAYATASSLIAAPMFRLNGGTIDCHNLLSQTQTPLVVCDWCVGGAMLNAVLNRSSAFVKTYNFIPAASSDFMDSSITIVAGPPTPTFTDVIEVQLPAGSRNMRVNMQEGPQLTFNATDAGDNNRIEETLKPYIDGGNWS